MAEKPHAIVDECLLLVEDKRKKARTAMHGLIAALVNDPYNIYIVPFILDYLTNMVYCIELMLKVLANSWRSHDIAAMYEKIFERKYDDHIMKEITTALRDQKYLFEPCGVLWKHVGTIELLYSELSERLNHEHSLYDVSKQVTIPVEFLAFLRDNANRFYRKAKEDLRDKRAIESLSPQEIHDRAARVERRFGKIAGNAGRMDEARPHIRSQLLGDRYAPSGLIAWEAIVSASSGGRISRGRLVRAGDVGPRHGFLMSEFSAAQLRVLVALDARTCWIVI